MKWRRTAASVKSAKLNRRLQYNCAKKHSEFSGCFLLELNPGGFPQVLNVRILSMDGIILLLVGMVGFFVLDGIWIYGLAQNFYTEKLAPLVGRGEWKLNPWAGVLAYFTLSLGLVFFVLPIARDLGEVILYGAIYGLVVYGVYDFTNAALFKKYSESLVWADLIWGMVASAVIASILFCLSGF